MIDLHELKRALVKDLEERRNMTIPLTGTLQDRYLEWGWWPVPNGRGGWDYVKLPDDDPAPRKASQGRRPEGTA